MNSLPGGPGPKLTVLVIAYYFPPMGLSGVQRTLKFVKYLAKSGWRVVVLTAGETPYYAVDNSLLDELSGFVESGNVRIYRTSNQGVPGARTAKKSGGIMKLPSAFYQRIRSKFIQVVLQPDSRIFWKKHALRTAEDIYRENKIDVILATAPPYTDFLIAEELRKKYGTPYMMDYRDAWVSNPVLNFYLTPFHRAYAAKLEDSALRASDGITVVNRAMKEILLRNYPFLTHEDVTIVPHGFDPDDFNRASKLEPVFPDPFKFRLTYTGTFYVGRSPKTMFEAVRIALDEEPLLNNDLELVFAGVLQKEYVKAAKKAGLSNYINQLGYLDHLKSVRVLMESSVLWMTMSDDISAPGKLYEYFGSGKPVLGLVPKGGLTEKLLQDYGAGHSAPPNDARKVADQILALYRAWHSGATPTSIDESFIASFDRETICRTMSYALAHIVHVVAE